MSLRKIALGFVALAAVVAVVAAPSAQAFTASDLAILKAILPQAQYDALVAASGVSTSGSAACSFTFTQNLKQGSTGTEVKNLQVVLNMSTDTQVAATGAGSPGNETTTFGPATKAAVIKFQEKYSAAILAPVGLTQGTGNVAAGTRAQLNKICSTPVVTNPTNPTNPTSPVTGSVTATLAADNTPARQVVQGQASAELAKFVFSGSGVVTNVTLQQIGLSAYNQTLKNVYLYNGATRLTDSGSVSSNGVITFNAPSGLFTVNGSQTVTVRADFESTSQTGTVGVALTGFAVSGAQYTASAQGNLMTIVNVTVASSTFSTTVSNPAANATVNAGTQNFTIWSNNLQVSQRAVNLRAITFRYIGSAPANSLSNIRFYVDGAQVGQPAMAQSINGSTFMVFDLSSMPYQLSTGNHTLEARADVVGGASYSFTVSIQNAADLLLEDSQLPGVFITAAGFPGNTAGNSVSILAGTNSVTVDSAFTATRVTGGATNVTIGSFKFSGYGEDVKISSLKVTPTLTGSTLGSSLNNVTLYLDGAQIGSLQQWTGSALTFNLGSQLTIYAGRTATLSVKADIVASSSAAHTSGNLYVNIAAPSANNAEGLSSHQTLTIPSTTGITSNSLTVGSNDVTVAKSNSLANSTVAPQTSGVKLGSYVIQAGASEGFTVNNLVVGLFSAAADCTYNCTTNIQNLKVSYNGVTANPLQPTQSNNFSANGVTIPVNQSLVVDVWGDVGSAATGTATTTLTVTGQGSVSRVSTTSSAIAGQVITISRGSVAAPSLVSAQTAQYQVGGASPVIATYKLMSTSSNATVEELAFTRSGNGVVSSLTLTAGGQTYTMPVNSATTTFTGLSIAVPAGYSGVNITVAPTYAPVDSNGNPSNETSTISLGYVKSRSGNTTTDIYQAVAANQMTIVGSRPTVSVSAPSNTSARTGKIEVIKVTVTADAAGDIKLSQLPLSFTTNSDASIAGFIGSTTLEVTASDNRDLNAATSSALSVSTDSTGSAIIYFGAGETISAGTSVTFTVKATVTAASTDAQFSSSLGAASSFKWVDVKGNVSGLTATLLPTSVYSTDSISFN